MHSIDPSELHGLSAPILSDVMDSLGMMGQAMRPFVRPLDENAVLIGRARTGLYMPYTRRGRVRTLTRSRSRWWTISSPATWWCWPATGPTERIAPWGELLSTASKVRGAVGCVTDGLVRDVRLIRDLGFLVFHGGIGPLDTKGRARMMERDTLVECAGVRVHSGDIVFGDIDGVVVIPQDRAAEVLARAREKLAGESHTRAELEQGRLLGEVYKKYGVL